MKVGGPYLVIIPAGQSSTHQRWTSDHRVSGFDLCLLNYSGGDFTDANSLSARYVVPCSGMKWKLVSAFIARNPELLQEYRFFLIMDDDIDTSPEEIARLFGVCEEHEFDLAQPGFGRGSQLSYRATRRIYGAKYHLTSTVEVMAPCFSRRLLVDAVSDFEACLFGLGWGFEGVWMKRFSNGCGRSIFGGKIGVIDCVRFYHRRPVGGHESGIYRKFGSPAAEMEDHQRRYGFTWGDDEPFRTCEVVWESLACRALYACSQSISRSSSRLRAVRRRVGGWLIGRRVTGAAG